MSELKQKSVISAPGGCFRFLIYCIISKPERPKGDWGEKSSPNVAVFVSPLMSEYFFQFQSMTNLLYTWWLLQGVGQDLSNGKNK